MQTHITDTTYISQRDAGIAPANVTNHWQRPQIATDHAEFSIGKREIFGNLNIARLRPICLVRFVSDLSGFSHFFTTL